MKRLIIDTDPGIDDAAAIFFALASPELSVEAITTVFGNGPVDVCTANALRIIHAAGRPDIPVYKGAGKPLARDPRQGWASAVHGDDALGNTWLPLSPMEVASGHGAMDVASGHGALELTRRVMESPGEITVLALGRLTNVALALALEPAFAGSVREIVHMGGALGVPGNVTPVASANIHEDPEAAAMVYRSGAPLVQVGLDVCNKVTVSAGQLERIYKTGTRPAELLAGATPFIQSYYRANGLLDDPAGARYNDMPAVAYLVDPGLFGSRRLHVEVETCGQRTLGQTVADLRAHGGQPPNATVCLQVDAPRVTELFTQRIEGLR